MGGGWRQWAHSIPCQAMSTSSVACGPLQRRSGRQGCWREGQAAEICLVKVLQYEKHGALHSTFLFRSIDKCFSLFKFAMKYYVLGNDNK